MLVKYYLTKWSNWSNSSRYILQFIWRCTRGLTVFLGPAYCGKRLPGFVLSDSYHQCWVLEGISYRGFGWMDNLRWTGFHSGPCSLPICRIWMSAACNKFILEAHLKLAVCITPNSLERQARDWLRLLNQKCELDSHFISRNMSEILKDTRKLTIAEDYKSWIILE